MSDSPKLFDSTGANDSFGERLDKVLSLTEVSQQRLAELAGVSPKAVYGWTRGVVPYKPNLQSIERATKFSAAFFRSPIPAVSITGLNYWARSAAPKYIRARFASFAFVTGALIQHVSAEVDLPEMKLAQMTDATAPESAAAEVRLGSRLGEAPVDPIALAESLGVVLVYGPPEIFDVDAFSAWAGDIPMIVLNPHRTEPFRIWHTVAHELGHLFMHDRDSGTELENSPEREGEAEGFADFLLMPNVSSFNEELQRAVRTYGWEALTRLSDKFRVSVRDLLTTAKIRGLERDLYLDERAVRLNVEQADLHYSDKTPTLSELTALSSRVEAICVDRDYTIEALAKEIGIPTRYVALLTARTTAQATNYDRLHGTR